MRTKHVAFLALLVLLLPTWAWSATYYVDASGGLDANPGTIGEPWQTITKINSYATSPGFANGDVIKLKRGETWTSDATLGAGVTFGVNGLTIEDYGTGDLPFLDGNSQMPIYISDATLSNLTIKNIDISGQGWQVAKSDMLRVYYVDGVTLDGIYADGHYGETYNGKNCISLRYITSGAMEVKNCTILNFGPLEIPGIMTDYMGIVFIGITGGTISVHDNVVHDIASDCLHFTSSAPTSAIVYDNELYNGGENSIDIKGMSNITIYDNSFYREAGFTGFGGSGNQSNILSVHDPNVFGIDNVVIRDNAISGNDARAIRVNAITGTCQIYNNAITAPSLGIAINYFADNVEVHHNLFSGGVDDCIFIGEEKPAYDTKIYNNVFSECDIGSIRIVNSINDAANSTFIIRNNISLSPDNYHVFLGVPISTNVFSNNDYYPDGAGTFSSTEGGEDVFADWATATGEEANSITTDPLVTSSSDFHLQSTSPCIDTGINVSLTTDYDGVAIPQGAGYDMGAYENMGLVFMNGCTISGGSIQ